MGVHQNSNYQNVSSLRSVSVHSFTLWCGPRVKPSSRTSCSWKIESMGKWELNIHTPKRTSISGVKVTMDSRIFKNRLQESKPMGLRSPYIIGNLLERRCLKWVCMTHLDIWNTSYSQKKGWEADNLIPDHKKLGIVQISLHVGGMQHTIEKLLTRTTTLHHLNRRSTHKVMDPQSCGNPNFGNFGTPTWESRDKMPFGCQSRG